MFGNALETPAIPWEQENLYASTSLFSDETPCHLFQRNFSKASFIFGTPWKHMRSWEKYHPWTTFGTLRIPSRRTLSLASSWSYEKHQALNDCLALKPATFPIVQPFVQYSGLWRDFGPQVIQPIITERKFPGEEVLLKNTVFF